MSAIEKYALHFAESFKVDLEFNEMVEYESHYILSKFEYQKLIKLTLYKNKVCLDLQIEKYNEKLDDFIIEFKVIKYKELLQNKIMSNKDLVLYYKCILEERIERIENNL